MARAASNIFSALVFGTLFFQMGRGQSSVQDRMGLLQVAAINAAMSSLIKTITVRGSCMEIRFAGQCCLLNGCVDDHLLSLFHFLPFLFLFPSSYGRRMPGMFLGYLFLPFY
jgi:hypothetical protein